MNFYPRKLFFIFLFVPVLFFCTGITDVLAGFGITPPYVRNTSLTRNSVYEQQILLVRGEANVAQRAEIVVDAPEIQDWITVLEGDNVPMPVGTQKVPITVRVTVPSDAKFQDYTGAIRIRTVPDTGEVAAGAVSISLGARVDIKLTVIDKQIKDFRVRKISAPDLNEGSKVAWLFFPGKIRFDMLLENTGNVPIMPSKVEFRIFDRAGKVLLEETSNLGKIPKVSPYITENVTAQIPTRLPAGSYIARYSIYNEDEIKQEGDITLNILPAGTLQLGGYGFVGLSISHKISILLPIFAALIALIYFLQSRRRLRTK